MDFLFFFFQAEDGIRDVAVTGVQTCALPIFVMPGTTIGDGTVIGADSLVHGTIPPYSLAVGSPAKVIRSAPDFPRPLSERQKTELVETIMAEFDRSVRHGGVTVGAEAPFRTYTRRRRAWRLPWLLGGQASPPAPR